MKKEEFERVDMRIPDYENTQKTQCQVLLQLIFNYVRRSARYSYN